MIPLDIIALAALSFLFGSLIGIAFQLARLHRLEHENAELKDRIKVYRERADRFTRGAYTGAARDLIRDGSVIFAGEITPTTQLDALLAEVDSLTPAQREIIGPAWAGTHLYSNDEHESQHDEHAGLRGRREEADEDTP